MPLPFPADTWYRTPPATCGSQLHPAAPRVLRPVHAGVGERRRHRAPPRAAARPLPRRRRRAVAQIKELEHAGDRLTHEVIDLLNRTFVTPFDRDDIYRLATALDDVCDHVDEAADNLDVYGVRTCRRRRAQQADVILRAAMQLARGGALLEGFKDSSRQLIELRELEDEGDRLARDAVAELFRSSRTRSRSSAGRTSTSGSRRPSTPARTPPTCSRRSSSRTAEPWRTSSWSSSIVVALGFDFTNGFHDTANAIATSVSTRALSPRSAVPIASVANLAGAFVDDRGREDGRQGDHRHGLATSRPCSPR